jgi:serine/threonine protein kinase
LKKGQTITPKNDIFSAGAIFHVLLTGKYLFDGKTPKDVFESNKNMAFDL